MNRNQRTIDAIRSLVRDAEADILDILQALEEDTGMHFDTLQAEHYDFTVLGDGKARRMLASVVIDLRL